MCEILAYKTNLGKLFELGFEITLHDKMPNEVLYRANKHMIKLTKRNAVVVFCKKKATDIVYVI